jgi:hypothetical protein
VPHRGSPHCAEWARGHNTVMALADALQALLRLPGATYSCVVERDSGRVLAEVGNGEAGSGDSEGVVPYSVPRWGTAVAAMFGTTSGDELDDVMITGRRSYHLVRPLGPDASVLVYLRLDRSRSNLAAARRELATVRLSGGAPTASSGAPAATPARSRGDAPAARARGTVAATSPAPARVPAALAPPSTPARGVRSTTSDSGSTSTAPSRPRAAAAVVPRARRSPASDASAAPSGGATARPADGSARQIPLPRRAPGQSASDAGPMRRRSDARSGRPASAAESEAAPEGFAMPTVLGQTWAQDPGTLRRLLAGLRRMA